MSVVHVYLLFMICLCIYGRLFSKYLLVPTLPLEGHCSSNYYLVLQHNRPYNNTFVHELFLKNQDHLPTIRNDAKIYVFKLEEHMLSIRDNIWEVFGLYLFYFLTLVV